MRYLKYAWLTVIMVGFTILLPFCLMVDALVDDLVDDFVDVWGDYLEALTGVRDEQNNTD